MLSTSGLTRALKKAFPVLSIGTVAIISNLGRETSWYIREKSFTSYKVECGVYEVVIAAQLFGT
jgi:hypothetical protein